MLHDRHGPSVQSSLPVPRDSIRRNKHASVDGQPFIVTLALDHETHETLTKLRTKYFPRHRNYLEAHVTLFHALPASHKSLYPTLLSEMATQRHSFPVRIGKPFSLGGKGIGVGITSPNIVNQAKGSSERPHPNKDRITRLRADLARLLEHEDVKLTAQDAKNQHSPHVTLQNKVDEKTASDSMEQLEQEDGEIFRGGWDARAIGLELYEYQADGTWTRMRQFEFAA
ncbi:hypothetical protein OIV83_001647 [Microbotryomycetes sp. JL201]|nr:hypothetical protein OIV83_001647 [Microbotryomycetes sp. JL201]